MYRIIGRPTKEIRRYLKAGQNVLYTGSIYTARDQAHKRLLDAIKKKKKLPIDLKDAIIYYTGPTPSRRKNRVGSAGPTTSSRMDKFTPELLRHGVAALIGKGDRSLEVVKAIKKNHAVYFVAVGGAGAYLSERIIHAYPVCYKDLGSEAIFHMDVEDFPLIVAVDAHGNNIFDNLRGVK